MTRQEKAALLPEEVDVKKLCKQLQDQLDKEFPFLQGKSEVTHTYGIAPDNLVRSGGFMITISNGKKGKAKRTVNIIAESNTEEMMGGGIFAKIDELEKEIIGLKRENKRLLTNK